MPTSEIPETVVQNPVALYHLAEASLVVKGEITGITYLFGGRGTSLNVDERDVPALLATGAFSRDPQYGGKRREDIWNTIAEDRHA